jgi:hypothetical protein
MERAERAHVRSGRGARTRDGFGVGGYWQRRTTSLLADAGIELEGRRPWDIRVHHDRFYRRAFTADSVGIAESYMDGDWDCDQLDEFVARIVRADLSSRVGTSGPCAGWLLSRSTLPQRPVSTLPVARGPWPVTRGRQGRTLPIALLHLIFIQRKQPRFHVPITSAKIPPAIRARRMLQPAGKTSQMTGDGS